MWLSSDLFQPHKLVTFRAQYNRAQKEHNYDNGKAYRLFIFIYYFPHKKCQPQLTSVQKFKRDAQWKTT